MMIATRIVISLLVASAACGFPRPPHLVDDGGSNAGGPEDAASHTAYQLLALAPSTATTGDTITLEGTFADAATVHFPGNVSQPATVLGPHRATVIVPATATAGGLTVETGGATLSPLPFRRTSFALGLEAFRGTYEQADVARLMPSLATARSDHATVGFGSYLYVIGGAAAGGYLNSVERTTINADGTLGEFATLTGATLSAARSGHTALVIGSSIYVIGGINDSGTLGSIERATINADGTLSAFSIEPIALVAARKYATVSMVGNFVYVIGGTDSGALSTVERAEISAAGSLGSFSTVSNVALGAGRSRHTATVLGRFLYVLGGSTVSGATNTIERTTIDGGGELSTFELIPLTTVTARTSHTSVAFGMSLYVLGGLASTGSLGTTEKANITPDGTLGSFATIPGVELTVPRSGHTAIVVHNHLYLMGGSNNGHLRDVERATINTGGRLGAFSVSANSTLTTTRRHAAVAVIGKFIYVIGGFGQDGAGPPLDTIERAIVNLDGSLGNFSILANVKLVKGRTNHRGTIIGSYVYVLGGNGGGGVGEDEGEPLSSIERAPIGPDGQLGTFVTALGTSLPYSSFNCVLVEGLVYAIGGLLGGSSEQRLMQQASIGVDGTLGDFAHAGDALLTVGRASSSAVMLGDTLYVFGGKSAVSGELSSVDEGVVTEGVVNSFLVSSNLMLASTSTSRSTAVLGHFLYLLGGTSGGNLSATVEVASFGPSGPTRTFAIAPGVQLSTPRAAHTSIVIGNFIYNIGGSVAAIEQAPLL